MKKSTKVSAVLLSLAILFSTILFPSSMYASTQDTPSLWAMDEVIDAEVYGLVNEEVSKGYKQNITRKDLATLGVLFFESITGEKITASEESPFTDADDEYILKAYSKNIVKGRGNGIFDPNGEATREEVSIVFYNTLKTADKLGISESDPVKYMVSKGILKGKGKDLALKDRCTKEQTILISKRIYELASKETGNPSKGLLWKVTGGKSDAYILGSIHIGKKELYPLNSKITDIFKKSDYLSVEANILDMEGVQEQIAEKAFYKDSTLKENISEETYELLVKKLDEYNIDYSVFEKAKPWYVSMVFATLDHQVAEYEIAMGIDQYFLTKAIFDAASNKEILELESIEFQIDLFDSFSPDMQEENLKEALLSLEKVNDENTAQEEIVEAMWDLWQKGDSKGFEELIDMATEEDSEYNQKFWHERNINMTNKVIDYLNDEEGKTYFVVFGAGHLYSKTGVLKALEEKGYKLEQIK